MYKKKTVRQDVHHLHGGLRHPHRAKAMRRCPWEMKDQISVVRWRRNQTYLARELQVKDFGAHLSGCFWSAWPVLSGVRHLPDPLALAAAHVLWTLHPPLSACESLPRQA